MKPIEFTDANFKQEVLNSTNPVLIDFWAVWCGPCRLVAPVIEDIAGEYDGKVKVGKLDVDNNPETATMYGIRSIPTMLIFKGGEVVDRIVGAVPKQKITEKLTSVLS